MSSSNWIRWWKFNLVGAIGIAVQLGALTLLKSGLGVNYMIATVLAVEATVLHNFVWHERYTWADRSSTSRLARLARFNLSNGIISILGNLALMRLLVGGLGVNYFIANVLSIAGCSLLNFFVSDRLVFTARQPQSICRCRSTDQMSSEFFSNG